MDFLKRLGFYLGGFSVGLVLLAFLFNGKRTQCHYGPEARVINDLEQKSWKAHPSIKHPIAVDSTSVYSFLAQSSIDFSQSNPQQLPCRKYVLNTYYTEKNYVLEVENCKDYVEITKQTLIDP